ncbi:MAG: acyl carrier protein [Ruminococcus sp.]|nr:acyl carrier protein [Ruminococcus sp.]MDD6634175.1 acyl carrier protein [Ruminococcus sp.]MDY3214599.1 acyl carrier protein [Ruminococcus sp.]CDF03143.1 acyl carrier protein [Ruminococcus sp. CAG:624]HOF68707.1 acyl carrier protein [Ruminococcus sp.]
MNRNEVLKKLNVIFRDVFDDDSIVINDRTTSNDIEEWDSIEHINLIGAVEDEFSMRFKMKEVSGMKNVGEMVDIICERGKF